MLLLDAIDRTRRPAQHGAILAGILLLLATLGLLDPPGRRPFAVSSAAAGLALLGIATRVNQRWDVSYKGHHIRYVNNAMTGERLWIDDRPAGKGTLGIRSEIRAALTNGDGQGDVIVSRSIAGFLTFRCRIVAEPAERAEPHDAAVVRLSDATLMEEVRRRGLS